MQVADKERRKREAELELLLGADKKQEKTEEFSKPEYDGRFDSYISKDRDFAVDPTHKEYKKVKSGHNKVQKRPKKY